MKGNRKTENERAQILWDMIVPLGFECQHMFIYKHTATGAIFDFGATNLELKDIIHMIILVTTKLQYKKGNVDARSFLADFLNVKEELENVQHAELTGTTHTLGR